MSQPRGWIPMPVDLRGTSCSAIGRIGPSSWPLTSWTKLTYSETGSPSCRMEYYNASDHLCFLKRNTVSLNSYFMSVMAVNSQYLEQLLILYFRALDKLINIPLRDSTRNIFAKLSIPLSCFLPKIRLMLKIVYVLLMCDIYEVLHTVW